MSFASLTRLNGLITLISGAGVILFNVLLIPQLIPASLEYPGLLLVNALLVFGLTALYIHHLNHAGILLHLGYWLSAVALFLNIGFNYYAAFAFPTLRDQFPDAVPVILGGSMSTAIGSAMIFSLLGNLLFFIAMLIAKRVPRWISGVLLAGTVLSLAMLLYNIPAIVVSLGLVAAGYTMMASSRTALLTTTQASFAE